MIKSNIILDYERLSRCGVEEAIFCESKTATQINEIIVQSLAQNRRLLMTRINSNQFEQLTQTAKENITYYPNARCAVLGSLNAPCDSAKIAIVSGGSSDAPICYETQITLNYHHIACDLFQDVGVAAIWRLLDIADQLKTYDVIIAVAGMEAALPTVLAGLVDSPIIAVPTSVGYGVATGGHTALAACLASCSGVMTMNIDNGYGAACSAIKIIRKINKKL